MQIPTKCTTNRAFIKKYFHFIRTYPLTRKDPAEMLRKTLLKIEQLVEKATGLERLIPASDDIKAMINHPNKSVVYQEEMEDEQGRFILYVPLKFVEPKESAGKIVEIYDMVYLPSSEKGK